MSGTFSKKSVTTEGAGKIVAAVEAKARQKGMAMSTTIVDAEGHLKAFSRMDGCPLLPVQISQDKAWTAIGLGMPGHEFWNMIKGDEVLRSYVPMIPRVAAIGGGYPIRTKAGELVGGLGVSGGSYEDDMECARAGLAAFEE